MDDLGFEDFYKRILSNANSDEAYAFISNSIIKCRVESDPSSSENPATGKWIVVSTDKGYGVIHENYIFKTEEEAKASLKLMQKEFISGHTQ